MTRRLMLTYLSLAAFVLLILEVPLGASFARQERRQIIADVQRDALVLATYAEEVLEGGIKLDLARIAADYQLQTSGRVVVVDATGLAIADSAPRAAKPADFSSRPEIAAALTGELTSGIRHSDTLATDLVYSAVPVASGGRVLGAVRITYPATALSERINRNWIALGMIALIVLAAASLIGWLLARSVTSPVRDLEDAAATLARGDLGTRAPEDSGPPELRALARTFNETAARLQVLMDSQRAFIADASHQLRTPLTALRLRLESLEPVDGAAGESEDLDAAVRESWRLSQIVDELLALASAESANPERMPADVGAIVRDRHDAWSALAEERGVTLRAEYADVPTALVAPGHLEQILDNYLSNALDAAPQNSSVAITTRRAGDWIEIGVRDEGPGMSDQNRARAFDRFWRAPGAERGSGSGLGLAIVQRLANASGGEAELRAAPGGGIEAVIRLRTSD
ncbi:MAG: ATP-binding protein [Actinomycetota bacterium]